MKIYLIDNSLMTMVWLVNVITSINEMEIIGYTGNIKKAIRTIASLKPDLVLYNYQLYANSRMDIIKKIKTINPDIKVATFSETELPEVKKSFINAGADYHFEMIKNNKKNTTAILQIIRELNIIKFTKKGPGSHNKIAIS